MNIRGLIFMGTRTHQAKATAQFMTDVLGLPSRTVDGSDAVFFDLVDGASLAVQPADEEREERTVGFLVDDVHAAAAELRSAGVDTDEIGETLPYRYVHFRGPDGRLYELVEHLPESNNTASTT